MPQTKGQNFQDVQDSALPVLGYATRTTDDTITSGIDTEFDTPLRMFATATPDAKLNFSAPNIIGANTTKKSNPSVNGGISTSTTASTINFQTQATTGLTFSITFPTATIGLFYRVLFSFTSTGTILGTFSASAASVGALVAPNTLITTGTMLIGYIDLEATATNAWKTAGSATSIIENSVSGTARIIRFASGATDNSSLIEQNETMALIGGGTWAFNSGTGVLSWSATANIALPGLADSVNQITAGNVTLTSGQVAYVTINRSGSGGSLTVTVATESSLTLTDSLIVLARRVGTTAYVGIPPVMLLQNGESKELGAGLSSENRTFVGISAESTSSAAWNTNLGAPLRTIPSDSSSVTTAVASIDTEIDKFNGQLRLTAGATVPSALPKRVTLSGADKTMLDTTIISETLSSLLLTFTGAQIDFTTGTVYASDGTSALGDNFTMPTIASTQYRWFSVTLVPTITQADNTMGAKLSVTAGASDGASPTAAIKPNFVSTGVPIGLIAVQGAVSGVNNISQANIRQLGQLGSAAPSTSGGTSGGLTSDLSTAGQTIASGFTLFYPDLTINTPDTFTVNGTLLGVDNIIVNGTLIIGASGSVRLLSTS